MTAAEVLKFYKYISDLNDNTFGKSDDHWRIWINNPSLDDCKVSHKLSFSFYHYFGKAGDNFKEVKRYDISLDEPLIVFLKAIEECKRIVQKYIIDNL